jgi:hypothetical protein
VTTDLDRLRRARQIFDEVIDLPAAARGPALAGACGDDEALLGMVERLIALDEAPSVLDTLPELGVVSVLASALEEDRLPTQLGRFQILSELGRGGMGVVYEARQDLPERRVALKTLPPWNLSPSAREQFRNEVQALARVLHPGIPQVYEVFEHAGVPVMAMELVDGLPLLEAGAPLDTRGRVRLLVGIARAVQHAHERGVIHRDLKPANVLVNQRGEPVVLDFGIAALGAGQARSAGTLSYIPPEQLDSSCGPDARSDVYSVAALGWELLLGAPPRAAEGLDAAALLALKRQPVTPPETLPRPLGAVLCKALAPEMAVRYPTAAALADDLGRYLDDWPVEALAGSRREWLLAHGRRLWQRGLLMALAGLAVGAGIFLGLELREVAQARQREGMAAAALEAVRAKAARLGDDEPSVADAFRSFTSDPLHEGTAALSEGWLWWGARAGADTRRDFAAAWLSAPDDESEQRALEALAGQLEREQRWRALSAVVRLLASDSAPGLRMAEALSRRDLAGARAHAPEELLPLLEVLSHARADPLPLDDGFFLADGERVLTEDGRLTRVSRDGKRVSSAAWPASERPDRALEDGDTLWLFASFEGEVFVYTWDRSDAPPALVERFEGSGRDMALADTDGDGAPERYTLLYNPNTLLRADPPGARSAPMVGDPPAGPRAIPHHLLALPAEGGDALVVVSGGWGDQDLRALRVADGAAALAGRLRMHAMRIQRGAQPGAVYVTGLAAGAPPPASAGPGHPRLTVSATWDGQRFSADAPHLMPAPDLYVMAAADLDADGDDELIFSRYDVSAGLLVMSPEAGGGWHELQLPGLRLVDVGEVDGTPGAEVWVTDGGASWLLGVDGAPPLPALEHPASAPSAPPEVARGWLRTRWQRAEALAALGMEEDAAALLGELGQRPGPAGAAALARAIALLGDDPEEAAPLARALAERERLEPGALTEEQRRAVGAVLWTVSDFQALSALPGAVGDRRLQRLAAPVTLHAADTGFADTWQVLDLAGVRYAPLSGTLELDLLSERGPALAMPLVWDGGDLDLTLDLELLEQDWATGLVVALEADGWRMEGQLNRTGGGPAEDHKHLLRCSWEEGDDHLPVAPVAMGSHQLRLSWTADSGELRCAHNGRGVTRTQAPPPAGLREARLVIGGMGWPNAPVGRVRARLRSLTVAGANPGEVGGDTTGADFVRGEIAAAARLRREGEPLERLLAGAAFGPPDPGALADLSPADVRYLLRTAPETWSGPLRARLGDELPALWKAAWDSGLSYKMPSAGRALLLPELAGLPLIDADASALMLERTRLLVDEGRTLEANTQLGLLLVGPSGAPGALTDDEGRQRWILAGAWQIAARLRLQAGDELGAREAIDAWLEAAPVRERAIDLLHDDPLLAPYAPEDAPAAQVITAP